MSSTQLPRVGGVAALVAGGVLTGGILAGTLTASADDTTASPSATAATEGLPGSQAPGSQAPGDPAQRPDEELLTGSTAQQVKDAVLAEYPGATFDRVETDSDGVYEAHITKADGNPLTIELDKSFAITGEEQLGAGGPVHGPDGDGSAESSSA